MNPDARSLLEWSARIASAGVLIQSLELLRLWPHLRDGGIFGWSPPTIPARSAIGRALARCHRFPLCAALLGFRAAAAAAVLLLPAQAPAAWCCLVLLCFLQAYCNRRFHMLRENADTFFLVVLAGAAVGLLPGGSPELARWAAGFIAFQAALAYGAAGIVKLRSPAWRNGTYLAAVLQERGLVGPDPAPAPRRALVRAATWGVIAGETLFPLALFLPAGPFCGVLAAGIVFHAGVTWLTGVHGFWWSFLAAYPALYWINAHLGTVLQA